MAQESKVGFGFKEETTADDPSRGRRRACASGPQVRQYIPVRFSALLARASACRPDAKGHRNPSCRGRRPDTGAAVNARGRHTAWAAVGIAVVVAVALPALAA